MRYGGRGISAFSVIVSFLAIALLGCVLAPMLPIKLVPSETLPSIRVSYSLRGASSRTIESEITAPLEAMLARVSGVKNIKSASRTGSGRITLEFDRNADIDKARFETSMIVRQSRSSLPEGTSYPSISVKQVDDDAAGPFMSYTVNAPISSGKIMKFVEDNIRPALSSLPDIASVDISGALPMEWRVTYDPNLLTSLSLSPDDIKAAISDYLGNEGKGKGTLIPNKILIKNHKGRNITLQEVASVRRTEAEPESYFRINGLNSIYLNITATEDANQIDLSKKIRDVLSGIDFPEDFMLDLSYDASETISTELDKIYFRTGLTILILLVFVALMTTNLRYLLIIAMSLMLNMAIAFVLYYFLHVEIQLYSLAGITISLNLVIDNLIVMTEHVVRRKNLKVFPAILAATLTTIGALSVVFFLDEKTMLSLKDFVIVVIVNLGVSLITALFLVPALVDRLGLTIHSKNAFSISKWRRKLSSLLNRLYIKTIRFICRFKWLFLILFAGGFALSVYIFVTKVYEGGYFDKNDNEPVLYVNATLPNGSTLSQMNTLISEMEGFLSQQEGIRQFQTNVSGPRRGSISIYFKPEYRGGYPFRLKADIISKALTLGGGSWSVYGLEDQGFNNDVRENAGNYRIKMRGYNYDELTARAKELADTLLLRKRIKEVTISSEFTWWKDDYTEFYLDIDRNRLNKDSLSVASLYSALRRETGRDISAGYISTSEGPEYIRIGSIDKNRDVWGFMNFPLTIGNRLIKLGDYASIEQRQTPKDVVKENQEYIMCLQYEYIGSDIQGRKVLDKILDSYIPTLPLGYHAEKYEYSRDEKSEGKKYLLLALIAVIIFFISAILFNSLRLPLAIILVIPVSFICVFLTFYLFSLKFDKGGFAALILLCGITVNAAIYIINEYISLRHCHPNANPYMLYIRAFRATISAVLLTVLSTVFGFIPFLIGDTMEGFWFPLAAGTIGGLVMSLAAVFLFLPMLILPKPKRSN